MHKLETTIHNKEVKHTFSMYHCICLPCRDLSSPITLSAFPFPSPAVRQTNCPTGAMIGPSFKREKMQFYEILHEGKTDDRTHTHTHHTPGQLLFCADDIVSHTAGNMGVGGGGDYSQLGEKLETWLIISHVTAIWKSTVHSRGL